MHVLLAILWRVYALPKYINVDMPLPTNGVESK
jgi:hypothetical protein